MKSYSSNANEINSQVDRYTQLEKSMALGNADPTVLAEYQDISNQLGELLPNIVAHEDEYGNKIIGSSEALKVKIELLKEQQALEAQMAEQEAKEKRDENIDTRKGAISDLKDKQKTIAQNAAIILDSNMASNILNNEKFSDDNGKPLLKTAADFEKKLNEIKKATIHC